MSETTMSVAVEKAIPSSVKLRFKPSLNWFGFVLVIFILGVGAILTYRFGGFSGALDYLAGERIIVAETDVSLGTMEEGRIYTAYFPLTNVSGKRVRILGGEVSCSCTTLSDLPTTLEPGASFRLVMNISTTGKSGTIRLPFKIFTDFPGKGIIALSINGTVTPSSVTVPSKS